VERGALMQPRNTRNPVGTDSTPSLIEVGRGCPHRAVRGEPRRTRSTRRSDPSQNTQVAPAFGLRAVDRRFSLCPLRLRNITTEGHEAHEGQTSPKTPRSRQRMDCVRFDRRCLASSAPFCGSQHPHCTRVPERESAFICVHRRLCFGLRVPFVCSVCSVVTSAALSLRGSLVLSPAPCLLSPVPRLLSLPAACT
jgi:hypothetical protein